MSRRAAWNVVAAISLSCASLTWGASRSSSALRAYNDGVRQANDGKCQAAIPLLDEAISNDRDFGEAYLARGYCRYQLKALENAAMDFSDAVRLTPEQLDARSMRGVVRYELDQTDAALEDFNYVLARKPTDSTALLQRGVIELKREQVSEAQRDFRAFVKAHPSHAMAPQVKKVLATLSGEPVEESAPAKASAPPRPRTAHRKAPTASAPEAAGVSAEALERARQLLEGRQRLSDQVGQKVLRGERPEAVGQIDSGAGGDR